MIKIPNNRLLFRDEQFRLVEVQSSESIVNVSLEILERHINT